MLAEQNGLPVAVVHFEPRGHVDCVQRMLVAVLVRIAEEIVLILRDTTRDFSAREHHQPMCGVDWHLVDVFGYVDIDAIITHALGVGVIHHVKEQILVEAVQNFGLLA